MRGWEVKIAVCAWEGERRERARKGEQERGCFPAVSWSCPPRRQPRAAGRQQDKFCWIELFPPGPERRGARSAAHFAPLALAYECPNQMYSLLWPFLCAPTSPVGQLGRLLFFLRGRSRSATDRGPSGAGLTDRFPGVPGRGERAENNESPVVGKPGIPLFPGRARRHQPRP